MFWSVDIWSNPAGSVFVHYVLRGKIKKKINLSKACFDPSILGQIPRDRILHIKYYGVKTNQNEVFKSMFWPSDVRSNSMGSVSAHWVLRGKIKIEINLSKTCFDLSILGQIPRDRCLHIKYYGVKTNQNETFKNMFWSSDVRSNPIGSVSTH